MTPEPLGLFPASCDDGGAALRGAQLAARGFAQYVHVLGAEVRQRVALEPSPESGSANLNSGISGNSGFRVGPRSVWQYGVSDDEEEGIGAARPPHPQCTIQGSLERLTPNEKYLAALPPMALAA